MERKRPLTDGGTQGRERSDEDARARDADLVRAAQGGDSAAFRAIYDRYAPGLYGLCVRKAGDAAGGRDLMQEVFVRAYRGLQQLREPGRLREWLYSIAFNVARTQAACEQRWQRTRAAFEPERLRFEPADQQEPLLRELRIEAVREAILDVKDEKHRLLLTRYYTGETEPTTRALAEELGLPASTVTVTLLRARASVTRRVVAALHALEGEAI